MKLLIVLCVLFHITSFYSACTANDEYGSEQNTPLHEAVLDGNYVSVKKLLIKGADKNAKNDFGRTPLHLAAERGFDNIMKLLLENSAQVDAGDNYGKLPIHFAAQYGHFEIFKLLVDESEKLNIDFVNATDVMKMSVLHFAAMNRKPRNTEMLTILIDKDASVNAIADDNTTPLHFACATGNPEMVRLLLDSGADVNVNFKDSAGDTPLAYAAYGTGQDRLKVFELLMLHNADVNSVNSNGETILFFVARYGGDDDRLAELLIKKGARVNDSNNKGETPLHLAARKGHKKLGENFIKHKANKDAKNNENQTPLHYAVKYGEFEFAEMLINHGANVVVEDENHNTPMHLAVEEALGNIKILELLSKNGDVNSFNKDGKSLLHLSIEKGGDMKIFKWLLDKGAKVEATDRDGRSLLHSAAENGRIDIVEWLIQDHPIDEIVNKQDNYGNAPLHLAAENGYYDLAKLLLSNGADVNAMNYDFEFPIHYAAHGGHDNIIKLLMKYDASVNVRNRIDWTPLYYAVFNGNEKVVKLLVNHKDEDFGLNDVDAQEKTVFHICAKKGSVSIGKILSFYGANVSALDEHGHSPLHLAAKKGNAEFVDWLIHTQLSQDRIQNEVDAADSIGRTPLHYAGENGNEDVVRTLLNQNPSVNLKDKANDTALSLAIVNGHRGVAKMLLKQTNKPNIKYGNKRELLLLAAEKGYDEICEMLISKNARVTTQDENKWTPLHYAAKNGHANIVKMLLNHGAEIDGKTSSNETAIMLAVQNDQYDVVDLLLKNDADISIPDDSERTLVDVAKRPSIVDRLTRYDKQRKQGALIFEIFIVVIFLLLVPLMCFIALFFHKLYHKDATDTVSGLKLTDLLERYMFPENQVKLSTPIGKSVFGTVHKGYAVKILPYESVTLVAVKAIKGNTTTAAGLAESQKTFLALGSELKVMMYCRGHPNIVNLLGIVSDHIANHELMVLVEYCRFGNLKDVLEKHHKNVKSQIIDSSTVQMSKSRPPGFGSARAVTQTDLASWSYQIAQGMQFISSQNIVHGNLAARSIFLTDGNYVKISDFGLARAMNKVDVYIQQKEGTLEYKWLAIESMQSKILNTKSDVWMFGNLLWELYSFGDNPFGEVEIYHLKRQILSGYLMERPPYANDNIYEVMVNCWRLNPDARPSFDSLEKWLYQLLG